jgi:hypothetical protein
MEQLPRKGVGFPASVEKSPGFNSPDFDLQSIDPRCKFPFLRAGYLPGRNNGIFFSTRLSGEFGWSACLV